MTVFCSKCGTKAIDGAEFCQKCGAKLIVDAPAERQAVPQVTMAHQPPPAQTNSKGKKKSKLPIMIGAIAAVIVLAIVFVALNWEGKTDYVAMVRAYEPFTNSQGLPYTCGEVLDKYIPNAEWNVRKADDEAFVDIRGTVEGKDSELMVTIRVEIAEDRATMKPVSVKLDGEEPAEDVFFALFVAYDEKDDSLSHLDELIREVDFALRGGQLAGAFADEKSGISFSYPDWWVTLDSPSEYEVVKMLSPRNNGNHIASFGITISLDSDPFGVFTGDEAFVRDSVNEYNTFLDYGDAMLGNLPAKVLRYQTAGLNGDDVVVALGYIVDGDVYWITCSYAESTSAVYEPIFQAMIESYTVTATAHADNLYYRGESLTDWIGRTSANAYDTFGWPDWGTVINGDLWGSEEYYGEYLGYDDGVEFGADYQTGMIVWIEAAADAVDFNGTALNKPRDELVSILGIPVYEYIYYDAMTESDCCRIEYHINGMVVDIDIPDSTGVAKSIFITQN